MTEVTRYDFSNECDGESGSCRERLVPDVSGDWVSHDAYAAVVAEREALQERIIAYSGEGARDVDSLLDGYTYTADAVRQIVAHTTAALAREVQGVRAVEKWGTTSLKRAVYRTAGEGGIWKAIDTSSPRDIVADSLPALGHKLIAGGHVDAG